VSSLKPGLFQGLERAFHNCLRRDGGAGDAVHLQALLLDDALLDAGGGNASVSGGVAQIFNLLCRRRAVG
jgi:hypothetical protein